ncbi:RNA polymerase II associated protein [Schizosaccharomyces japonicus yFS275]|uniref:Probable RNA polymerase II nuclear localization protein SLC7A6OS n=1 Tax=Schizosaccharomyces japonicus (strain yFS275 / FY16936) TaxID=402676 RepID=B6JVH2_SCHJY|nr:RNA polymerase II associated protein [Schizosaccharomyces japonicus yFS275]EEB05373.2 RNA polymerase II associated protein [Schizosaccharomyces japonicus yFS275]
MAPPILRVKRKASEDPVQALYLQLGDPAHTGTPSKKTKVNGNFCFQLAKTIHGPSAGAPVEPYAPPPVISANPPQTKQRPSWIDSGHVGIPRVVAADEFATPSKRKFSPSANSQTHKKFAIQEIESGTTGNVFDAVLSDYVEEEKPSNVHPQLQYMVKEYLGTEDQFVYDIYTINSSNSPKPTTDFGVIDASAVPEMFRQNLENELLLDDSDDNTSDDGDDVDEDSNAESFYQNSYPDEDEWYEGPDHSESEFGESSEDYY